MRKTLLVLSLVVLCGCAEGRPVVATASNGCKVTQYGERVFFFDCSDAFGTALNEFARTHEIVTVTSYTSYLAATIKSGTSGYWVVTRPTNEARP